jgi:hypothetical protein
MRVALRRAARCALKDEATRGFVKQQLAAFARLIERNGQSR